MWEGPHVPSKTSFKHDQHIHVQQGSFNYWRCPSLKLGWSSLSHTQTQVCMSHAKGCKEPGLLRALQQRIDLPLHKERVCWRVTHKQVKHSCVIKGYGRCCYGNCKAHTCIPDATTTPIQRWTLSAQNKLNWKMFDWDKQTVAEQPFYGPFNL